MSEKFTMLARDLPKGYTAVLKGDVTHVVDLDEWEREGGDLAMRTPVCDDATAYASWECSAAITVTGIVECWRCISIVS